MTTAPRASHRAPWVRAVLVTLALAFAGAFVALGVWQVERRAWKHELIAAVAARAHGVPVAAPAAGVAVNEKGDAYRRVFADGQFMQGKDILVQAVSDAGAGYWVITPLRTPGQAILINRGFIPQSQKSDVPVAPAGPVHVTGLLRITEPGGGFLRSNDPAGNRWYSRDVAAIARAQSLSNAAPYFIDRDGSANAAGQPLGGLTVLKFTDNHAVYALTWFALALLSLWAALYIWRERRGGALKDTA